MLDVERKRLRLLSYPTNYEGCRDWIRVFRWSRDRAARGRKGKTLGNDIMCIFDKVSWKTESPYSF